MDESQQSRGARTLNYSSDVRPRLVRSSSFARPEVSHCGVVEDGITEGCSLTVVLGGIEIWFASAVGRIQKQSEVRPHLRQT
jgi:hypothetical protein